MACQEEFDEIYLKYQKKLLAIAIREIKDYQLAEDLVQSVFLKLLTNYGKLKNHPNIQGWLIRTLENQLNNEKSRAYHSREIALEETYVPAAEDPFEPGFSEVLPSELGERERELLYLHVEVGLPHREIAKYLGCSTEACRMRLSRAKEHCQRVMKKFSG